jgi:outer membrane protein OmpA-like peptidoglycan-associated protein
MIRVLQRLSPSDRRKLEAGVVEVTGEAKNRTILGIVAGVMKLYPNITFAELKEMLPDHLNPKSTNRTTNFFDPYTTRPYGVVQPGSIREEIAKANRLKRKETGAEEHYKMVHFTGEGETFRTGDGVEVLVANGIEDADLQRLIKHVAQYGVRVVEFTPYRGGGKKGYYNLKVLDPVLFDKLQKGYPGRRKWLMPVLLIVLLICLVLAYFVLNSKDQPVSVPAAPVEQPFKANGVVRDRSTGLPLPGVTVTFKPASGEPVQLYTDEIGAYELSVPLANLVADGLEATLAFSKEGYLNVKDTVAIPSNGAGIRLLQRDMFLDPFVERPIVLPHIAYDLNQYELTPEAKDSLEGLYQTLLDNPGVSIEVRAHTDIRPAPNFRGGNLELSQKRAEACVAYLVERGIDPTRLVAVGMGSDEPLIPLDSIKRVSSMDEKERLHAMNRRSDFKVIRTE